MINDSDVILHHLMGGTEVNRCMEREREPPCTPSQGQARHTINLVLRHWDGSSFCQADSPLDPEACESHESTLAPATVLYS